MPAESPFRTVDAPRSTGARLPIDLAAAACTLATLRGSETKLDFLVGELSRLGLRTTIVHTDRLLGGPTESSTPHVPDGAWDCLYGLGLARCALYPSEGVPGLDGTALPQGPAEDQVLVARLGDRYAPSLLIARGALEAQSLPWWTALFEQASRSLDAEAAAAPGLAAAELDALETLKSQLAHLESPDVVVRTATDALTGSREGLGAAMMLKEPVRRRLRASHWASAITLDERDQLAVLLNRGVVRTCLEQALDPPRTVAMTDVAQREGLPISAHAVPRGEIRSLLATPVINADGRLACVLLVWTRGSGRALSNGDRLMAAETARIVGRALGAHSFQAWPDRAVAGPRRDRAAAPPDQLDAVFDAVLFGLVVIGLDGSLLKLNAAGRRVLDVTQTRAPSLRYYDDMDPRLLNGSLVPREIFPLSGPTPGVFSGNLDFSIRTRSGVRRELGLTGVPVHGVGGHVQAMLYVFRDVSERRHLERQKNEFLSIASHELKTPLTSLKGYAQSLARRLDRNPDSVTQDEVREKLRRMNRQVDRIAMLIEDMLDVSRAQSGKLSLRLEHVDLRDIVHEVVERTFPSPQDDPRKHPLHVRVPEVPVLGNWDRTRIDQVLTNLLTNAAKYSPPGAPIVVVLGQRDGLARLEVRDRGIGIPTDEQEHLFQPFFRARNASSNDYSGIGLGLYLSRELVLRHGGDITVTSAEGKGSVIQVELPCLAPTS